MHRDAHRIARWATIRAALLATAVAAAAVAPPRAKAQPLPPATSRIGVYSWLGHMPAMPPGVDDLTYALRDAQRMHFQFVRVFVGGRYDYRNPFRSPMRFSEVKAPVTLESILALPRYRRLLEEPSFQTIWLTAYPVFDYGSGPDEIDLTRAVGDAGWQREYDQMRQMVEWLYRNFGQSQKTILISNNEADEKLREMLNAGLPPAAATAVLARDLDTRFRAVADARRAYGAANLRVFTGPEISLWRLRLKRDGTGKYANAPEHDGAGAGVNVLHDVLGRTHFDFVSFSAWETTAQDSTMGRLAAALAEIARQTQGGVSAEGRKFFGARHVLVGEFGWAREWNIPRATVARSLSALRAVLESGAVRYAVYWQLYDNQLATPAGFGLIGADGNLTCTGADLLRLLLAAPSGRETSCAAP